MISCVIPPYSGLDCPVRWFLAQAYHILRTLRRKFPEWTAMLPEWKQTVERERPKNDEYRQNSLLPSCFGGICMRTFCPHGRGRGLLFKHHDGFFFAGVVVPQEPAILVFIYTIGVIQNDEIVSVYIREWQRVRHAQIL